MWLRPNIWEGVLESRLKSEVSIVQNMDENCKTMVGCAVDVKEEFTVDVGLDFWSTLSAFLFAVVIDRLTLSDQQLFRISRLQALVE